MLCVPLAICCIATLCLSVFIGLKNCILLSVNHYLDVCNASSLFFVLGAPLPTSNFPVWTIAKR